MIFDDPNPFLRYRTRLESYDLARGAAWTDAEFVSVVRRLDEAVTAVDGRGFEVTPLVRSAALGSAIGLGRPIAIKDETRNVAGSHKARHLFGSLLHHAVLGYPPGILAIASCGNAAVAAATLARAVDRPLRVFVPTWADPTVIAILDRLGADVETCERRPGEDGDPAYLRFSEAVECGAVPFSVQSTLTPTAVDGGRTIGWEIAESIGEPERIRVFVQVGGGALATSVTAGITEGTETSRVPHVLHAVQTEACAPLDRAWRALTAGVAGQLGFDLPEAASARADAFRHAGQIAVSRAIVAMEEEHWMQPWPDVGSSAATGILDDVTYDWRGVCEPMLRQGGWPVVVGEDLVLEANRLARLHTDIPVDHTGSAGLAGLLAPETLPEISSGDEVLVLFTGVDRDQVTPTP